MLSHACGAVFDNPDLIVAAVVGDGEAETGPLATSWHVNKFLSPIRDGAVLPVLSLNGYKINNPTLLARIPSDELLDLLRGYGWTPLLVEGSEPESVHQASRQVRRRGSCRGFPRITSRRNSDDRRSASGRGRRRFNVR